MASLLISSAAVTAVSQAATSQARQVVVPFNGTKLSNSAVTQTHARSLVAPFTGLKSNSTFPMSRKVDNITSLSSNGGRAKCLDPSALTVASSVAWIPQDDGSIEFKGGDLQNWGEVDVSTLKKGKEYEVIYYVLMKNSTVSNTFTLSLKLPNGNTSMVTKEFTVTPGELAAVTVGTFKHTFRKGNIKFTLNSDTPAAWVGLIIDEVTIS